MNPYVKLQEELEVMDSKALTAHILWLYRYIEEIKEQLRMARVRV